MVRARPPLGWQQRLSAVFMEHLPLKASAVLLAIALWFVVGAREPTEEVVAVRFEAQLDSTLVMRDPPPLIRALVMGRPSEILKLSNAPLVIRRTIAGDTPDTLVVALRTSDVSVPEGTEVIVRDVQPRAIPLRFEAIASREIPVHSALVARAGGSGDATGTMRVRLEPEHVMVRGPRLTLLRMSWIPTVAETLTVSDTFPHLVDLDTARLGVTVKPAQVKATITRGLQPRAPRDTMHRP